MAAGAPVIAFGEGGATETLTAETGVFFRPQTKQALIEAVMKFEAGTVRISPEKCSERAKLFTRERFQHGIATVIHRTGWSVGRIPLCFRRKF